MFVRGVRIVAMRGPVESSGAELLVRDSDAGPSDAARGAPPDEHRLRSVCAAGLMEAAVRKLETVALPAAGVGQGASPSTTARILVQEAIRVARSGDSALRKIMLCCDSEKGFRSFERTVHGYLRHFLDVLIWGPFVTVDALIETPAGVVLIERRNPPLGFALPGGFVDYGESLEEAVRREAREETGLELQDLGQFHTYSDPRRDPRFHTITTVFTARADGEPKAGDDAAAVRVVPLSEIRSLPFAFDHGQVLEEWGRRRPLQAS